MQSKYRCISLIYKSEHLLYTWILLLKCIVDAMICTCRGRDEIRPWSRSSSILDHFPNIRRSNIERMQSKYRCISLIYKSEHLLYTWILLLKCIVDAMICTCRGRDEIRPWSRSSSILDHFPNIRRSNIERMQSKYRCISLIYKSEHLLYTWILLLKCVVDYIQGKYVDSSIERSQCDFVEHRENGPGWNSKLNWFRLDEDKCKC